MACGVLRTALQSSSLTASTPTLISSPQGTPSPISRTTFCVSLVVVLRADHLAVCLSLRELVFELFLFFLTEVVYIGHPGSPFQRRRTDRRLPRRIPPSGR